ncbi:MAG: FecR domain-containing protein [Dongiaceae bacterium]
MSIGLLLALGGGAALAQDNTPATIGLVYQKEFNGALGQLQSNQRQLLYSLPVYGSELVTTDAKGTTALEFLDKTQLQVGANSHITLDRYVYDPATGEGEQALHFSAGVFRFVSGGMKKENVQLRTPTASMSIRGTKVLVYVDKDGSSIFYFESGWGTVKTDCGNTGDVQTGQSAVIRGCTITVVPTNLIPTALPEQPVPDEITALLNLLDNLEPAAGPPPPGNNNPTSSDPQGRGGFASPS